MIEVFPQKASAWSDVSRNVYSQFGEDGLLAEVFRRIGTTNKQCFECGAADGKWFSNSRLLIDDGWRACLIESDPSNYPELDRLDGGKVTVVHGKAEPVGPNSIDSILKLCSFDDKPDLGILDVDGQEYYLWNGMQHFRPRVMLVEYDQYAPANFVPDLGGPGQACFAAICSIAASKGYCNVAVTPTNALFILDSEREKFMSTISVPAPVPAPAPVPEAAPPTLATGKEQEIKIAAVLSRPRFGLNVFWDCASEALAPWHIPIQSFYGVFWGSCMQKAFEDNIAEGIDWILTLDYDTLFTSRHVQLLIDALGQHAEIDAIAALQPRRGRPLPLMVRSDGEAPMTGGPVRATTAHFGLTILRAESIKKLKKPWFWSQPTPDGGWGEGRLDDDIYFWGKWREAGNALYVHTGCKIGHVEEMAAQYNGDYKVEHKYLSTWRSENGHRIKSFE